jgi:bacillithiol system protein YtxJ
MFFSNKNSPKSFSWSMLTTPENVDKLLDKSHEKPIVLFKHSGRCSISAMALNRFEDFALEIESYADLYMIDVLNNRPASLRVAEKTGVVHQSPQVIVIQGGMAVYDESHGSIDGRKILQLLYAFKGK